MVQEHQPAPTNGMSQTKPAANLVQKYSEGAAKEAGKQTTEYVAQNPDTQVQLNEAEQKAQQGYEDAKAQAQGMWAKYCSCLTG